MGRKPVYCTAFLAFRLLALTLGPLLVQLGVVGVVDNEYFVAMTALSAVAIAADYLAFRVLRHAGTCLVCLTLYLSQGAVLLHLKTEMSHAHQVAEGARLKGDMKVQNMLIAAQAKYADMLKEHGFHKPEVHKLPKGHPLSWLHSHAHDGKLPSEVQHQVDHLTQQLVAAGKTPHKQPAVAPSPASMMPSPAPKFGGTLHGGQVKTISVVLPCAEERQNALKTVERFCQRTPEAKLAEIIVVDDGSEPPLATLFEKDARRLDKDPRCKVRILRHEQTQGLMNAKQTGGQAAIGDVIGFFDCHVAPQMGWEAEIIQKVAENPRRMMVPAITDLDMDTFDEKVGSAVNAKCYLTFDADFKWFDDESDYIPTISGGLCAMGREWFNMTGGFDNEMHGWGGENLDQSLRCWLCGGEIMRASSSRIAHMWRTGDPRTGSHYVVKARGTNNRGRVVAAWYDVFIPFFRGHAASQSEVKNYDVVKQRLACKPFSFFLYRFRKMYIEGGVIPLRQFNLREKSTGFCLASNGGRTVSAKCNAEDGGQKFQWGNVNREDGGKCCSGIRLAESNDCLDYFDQSGSHFYSCDVAGKNMNQRLIFREDGRIVKEYDHPHTCLFFERKRGRPLQRKDCNELKPGEGVWEEYHPFVPVVMRTYKAEVELHRYDQEFPNLLDN